MKLFVGLLLAIVAQFALASVHLWWVLAACQPLLLVVVAASRRFAPVQTGWIGLAIGLLTDVIADRVIGPGGIAGALAGLVVAHVVRRFELEGPLFWSVGSLLASTLSELTWLGITATLGAVGDHGFVGSFATVAMTGAAGLTVAAGDRLARWWRSPERARRRVLKQL